MARAPDVNHLHSVKIDNITCTSENFIRAKEELREKFEKFGEIGDVYIPRDRNFAFVRFREKRDAEDAADAMDGKDILGQEVRVSLSMQAKKAAEEYAAQGRRRRSRSRRRRSDSRSESYSESSSRSRDRRRRRRRDSGSRTRRRR
ncbi:unnamed protein product [Durusdinium trenchii]|uniref:35 kDa) (Splicing factor SC35) (SC-35) (Splicing factor n=2 Tax=Durusdinium trenchii TaxID=1381693 RepID=A0ABP0QD85_9DINO